MRRNPAGLRLPHRGANRAPAPTPGPVPANDNWPRPVEPLPTKPRSNVIPFPGGKRPPPRPPRPLPPLPPGWNIPWNLLPKPRGIPGLAPDIAQQLWWVWNDSGVEPGLRPMNPGWQFLGTCPGGPVQFATWDSHAVNQGQCFVAQAIAPAAMKGLQEEVPASQSRWTIWASGLLGAWRNREAWIRPLGPKEQPTQIMLGWVMPEISVRWSPMMDPDALPILQPANTPSPVPVRYLPHRVNSPFPQGNTHLSPRALPVNASYAWVTVHDIYNPRAWPRPGLAYNRAPVPGREREKKLNLTIATNMPTLNRGIGMITEGTDVIDALYEALPEEIKKRRKGNRPADRLALLWNEWENYSGDVSGYWYRAILELLKQQAEDKLYAAAGKAAGKLARDRGWPNAPKIPKLPRIPKGKGT